MQSFFFHYHLKDFFRLIALQLILGKEKHSHCKTAVLWQLELCDLLYKIIMGQLQQNPYAITGFAQRILPRSVLQTFYNSQRVVHRFVGALSLQIYYGANTAVVMLQSRTI